MAVAERPDGHAVVLPVLGMLLLLPATIVGGVSILRARDRGERDASVWLPSLLVAAAWLVTVIALVRHL
jgi:hypothetical protein